MNEFAGNVKYDKSYYEAEFVEPKYSYPKLPKDESFQDDFYGGGKEVVSSFRYNLAISLAIIFGIAFLIVGFTFIKTFKNQDFSTEIDQVINSYFNQTTSNRFINTNEFTNSFNLNATIVNNIQVFVNSS